MRIEIYSCLLKKKRWKRLERKFINSVNSSFILYLRTHDGSWGWICWHYWHKVRLIRTKRFSYILKWIIKQILTNRQNFLGWDILCHAIIQFSLNFQTVGIKTYLAYYMRLFSFLMAKKTSYTYNFRTILLISLACLTTIRSIFLLCSTIPFDECV